MILYRVEQFWHEYGFNIMLSLAILFLFIYWLFQKNGSGTYSVKPSSIMGFTNSPISNSRSKSVDNNYDNSSRDSKFEQCVRRNLREIFNKPFNKARPDFLRNPVTVNFNLELDCFEPQMRLAVEAQGIQHYKYTPYFHKSKEAFQNQQYRDELKRRMCKDNGITLIEVPYTVKDDKMRVYLLEKLRAVGYGV
jgi:hypothetical protein